MLLNQLYNTQKVILKSNKITWSATAGLEDFDRYPKIKKAEKGEKE